MRNLVLFIILFFIYVNAYAASERQLVVADSVVVTESGDSDWVCFPPRATNIVITMAEVDILGTGPSMDVIIQHSANQIHVFPLVTFTKVTTTEVPEIVHINNASTHVLRCVRANYVLAGSGPSYTVTIIIYYQLGN